MRIVRNIGLLLGAVLFFAEPLEAHFVTWFPQNVSGQTPSIPLVIYYPDGAPGWVNVQPFMGEPCTVTVTLDPVASSLISASVIGNTDNTVEIRVVALRAPSNHLETATITGSWSATGFPFGYDCFGGGPISAPITVSDQQPRILIGVTQNYSWININTGYPAFLQRSTCLTGPWYNVGQGQMFSILNDMPMAYYKRNVKQAGYFTGVVIDSTGNPKPNYYLGYDYGGLSLITKFDGTYSSPTPVAEGMNLVTVGPTNNMNTNGYVTLGPIISIPVPTKGNTSANFVVAMAPETNEVPTNVCNCTPWAAIGFAYLANGQTPVYYSGGANTPKGQTATCDQPVVTVTPPSGISFTITPGTGQEQNSGRNPASGTWTVSTTVCTLTKTVSVEVP